MMDQSQQNWYMSVLLQTHLHQQEVVYLNIFGQVLFPEKSVALYGWL